MYRRTNTLYCVRETCCSRIFLVDIRPDGKLYAECERCGAVYDLIERTRVV